MHIVYNILVLSKISLVEIEFYVLLEMAFRQIETNLINVHNIEWEKRPESRRFSPVGCLIYAVTMMPTF
jgi:hypothetical protein